MLKVLIVDDEEPILNLLSAILSNVPDYKVKRACNGKEALEMIETEKPDIVLLDNRMPGISGIEVCRSIKSNPELAHARILMLSCQGQNFDWQLARKNGADAYIAKPFDTDLLLEKVEQLAK